LAGQVRDLQGHADRLRATAEKDGDIRAALMALKTLSDLVELLVKVQTTDREARAEVHLADMRRHAERYAEKLGLPPDAADEILERAIELANETN
jgi:hypothetical protein